MGKPVYVMVDVETDGPCPGLYSMIQLGAVIVEPKLNRTFHGKLRPVTELYQAEALAVSGYTRAMCFAQDHLPAQHVMSAFAKWLADNITAAQRPVFVSDNNGFDWQFVNYYFWLTMGENPFGHSSINLNSLHKGVVRNLCESFKHLRKTAHTHNPVDDAMGNAEALLTIFNDFDLKPRYLP